MPDEIREDEEPEVEGHGATSERSGATSDRSGASNAHDDDESDDVEAHSFVQGGSAEGVGAEGQAGE